MSFEGPMMRLFGLGGAGSKIADSIAVSTGGRFSTILLDTDRAELEALTHAEKVLLGETRFRGLGSGGDMEAVRMEARESHEKLVSLFDGLSVAVFILGLGGGTGVGLLPELLKIAYEHNIRTLVFSVKPFAFEGADIQRAAGISAQRISNLGDVRFLLSNDELVGSTALERLTLPEAFRRATETLSAAVALLWRMVHLPGYLNLSSAALLQILTEARGTAKLALARASGEGREDAIFSILGANPNLGLKDRTVDIHAALVGICGGRDLLLSEIGNTMTCIGEYLQPGTPVKVSTIVDEALTGSMEVVLFLFREWNPVVVQEASAEPFPSPMPEPAENPPSVPVSFTDRSSPVRITGGGRSDTSRDFLSSTGKKIKGRYSETNPIYYKTEALDEPTWRRKRLNIDFH
ncbi:MAG: hypothetical protein ACI4QT_03245 [Kiritimatiellia bacterium]